LGPIGVNVTHTARQFREKRGLGYADLSRKLAKMGREIPPLGLRRIESGGRRVDVDDLVALALALEVSPLVLLLPAETSSVTAKGDRYVAERIWSWARGEVMLDDVGPSRNLQFMQDSLPLVDWPKYAEELAEKVRELRHGDD